MLKSALSELAGRDGYPADPEDIYLTTGASGGVSNILQLAISDPSCGVLIPIPQYPLYTAALALNNAIAVSYYLQEDDKWGIDINEMRASVHKAREEGTDVRAVVVINPGNPTGQCLSEENMAEIVKLAYEEKMVIVADEVYQTNVFDPETKPFKSFKSVVRRLGPPYSENQELVSFHSISKGQVGECGRRGGYYELVNMADEAKEQIYKLASIQLCSNVAGQIGVDLMVNPPKEGEESYELYTKEITSIQASLKKRSEKIHQAFEKMENVTCNHAEVSYTPCSTACRLDSDTCSLCTTGRAIPLPADRPAERRNRGRQVRRQSARRLLLPATARADGHLRHSRLWLRAEGGDAALPDDVLGAGSGGVRRQDKGLPRWL